MRRPTNRAPRPTPTELGAIAARTLGTLKGLPFGPGPRQDEFIEGFKNELLELSHATARARDLSHAIREAA